MRGIRSVVWAVLTAAVILSPVSCCSPRLASLQSVKAPEAIESHGFRFQFRSFSTATMVNYRTGKIDRRLNMGAEISDVQGGQVATVRHAIQLEEVRDESGRDLIALAVLPAGMRKVDDEPATFPFFVDAQKLEDGGRFAYGPSAWIAGLPESPQRLSVLRGTVEVLVAKRLSKHDVAVDPMPDWRELSPGLSIRITKVEQVGGRIAVNYLIRTIPGGNLPVDAEWLRWYNVENLNAEGQRISQYLGITGNYNTESGLGNGTFMTDVEPQAQRVGTLRITVIDEIESFVIPFDYRDIQLQ